MPGGLHNLGQTCAINSIIQFIAHCGVLRSIILDAYSNLPLKHSTMTWQLGDVIDKIYTHKKNVRADGFMQIIHTQFPEYVHRNEQQDMGELWMLISNKVADELAMKDRVHSINVMRNFKKDILEKVSKCINATNNNMTSQWRQAIQYVQLSVVQCNACNDQSWNPEVFMSFQLDIPLNTNNNHKKIKSISDLVLSNYAIEEITERTCDKCKQTTCGGKKHNQVFSLPTVLVIMLKRFRMLPNGHLVKVHEAVNVEEHLVFATQDRTIKYQLKCVGNHYGSYGGGHCNTCVLTDNNEWVCYDDANTIDFKKEFLENNHDAYLLCYEIAQ